MGQRLRGMIRKERADDLEFLRQVVEEGKVVPVIDRTFSLDEVPEAIRYVHEGHARGKVVITLRDSDEG
ncbi:zinc-binding dehydrogenase (plasmid) [Embleya sp. NBC_00896]|nr:zinc-binding dehydrogenase [Embleya sp. NBC_00896]